MIKDMRGVDLVPGDIILWQNIIMRVKEVTDGNILQIQGVRGNQAKTQMVPAKIKCEIELAIDPSHPIQGCFKLTQPEEKAEIEATNNRIASA